LSLLRWANSIFAGHPLRQEFLIKVVLIAVLFNALLGLFSLMTYLERRILAFMQFRLGPNRTGPIGLFQPIADGIKLFFKEELIPEGANRWVFAIAPGFAIVTAFTAIAVVPYGGSITLPAAGQILGGWLPSWLRGRQVALQIADLDVGVLFIFAVTALGVYGIVLAGWSSNSKFSLFGALRSSAQMFSYELALGLSWVGIIMIAGSFKIGDIVESQAGPFWNWNISPLRQFLGFLTYSVAAAAEVSRIPFDLPESEAELVAGFHTEYSSMKFALIQMAEYVNMITVSVLAVDLFLGGWHSGLPWILPEGNLFGIVWFGLKVAVVLFVFIWLRGTLPRFRYDQLMRFGWKVLIPIATFNVVATSVYFTFWGRS
jgi:NADH-quinone oxidoreductase subunit H